MAYWLDEGMDGWPQIDAVGTAAAGLYWRCGLYIARTRTDGFIPAARARMYGTPEWISRLADVGLWTVEENGFQDMHYFPLNPTAAEVERRRKQAAERQQRFRERQSKPKTRKSRDSNALHNPSVTVPPSPTSPKGEGKGSRPTPHEYEDGDGAGCVRCPLPYANPVHQLRSVG